MHKEPMAPFVVFLRRTEMKIELSTFCTNFVEKRKKCGKPYTFFPHMRIEEKPIK